MSEEPINPADPRSRPAIHRPEVRERCREASGLALRILGCVQSGANGCWVFERTPQRDGYSMIKVGGGRSRVTHRVLYELLVGPVDLGHEVDHLCRNRRCVNPEHLEAVTRSENVRRSLNGVRQTVCRAGHAIVGANAYRRESAGTVRCKTCYFADNKRRQKARICCDLCGRPMTRGSLVRHVRENCPQAAAA